MLAKGATVVQGLTDQSDLDSIRHKTRGRCRSGKLCQLERNCSNSLGDNTNSQGAALFSAEKGSLESGGVFQL